MDGRYLRMTAEQLARTVADPAWALELVDQIQDSDGDADLPAAMAGYLTTHEAWHAIGFLLQRANFPVDIVYGEQQFAESEDWGHGPPRYLDADDVRVAADALAATGFDAVTADVTSADLARADIYPQMWDEPDSLEWVRRWYEPLAAFFSDAATQGDAVLVWLD